MPEHGARRSHFIFDDFPDQLRESIGSFVERELAPHPEQYGGQGGDYFCNLVLAEELTRSDSGGLVMGVAVHTDMATPPILKFGTEKQKQKLHAARIAVEVADECIQIHGGAGYMKEYGIERIWRVLRLNRIGAGTDEIMLDVIGRSYGL
ncbi:MAG: acyl-CoA dehydrogenase family protein [Solirubrobacterales bacterium]|nr:acyl-CoA dehydrogenase family protein [Solirubrobacterales bacterium]